MRDVPIYLHDGRILPPPPSSSPVRAPQRRSSARACDKKKSTYSVRSAGLALSVWVWLRTMGTSLGNSFSRSRQTTSGIALELLKFNRKWFQSHRRYNHGIRKSNYNDFTNNKSNYNKFGPCLLPENWPGARSSSHPTTILFSGSSDKGSSRGTAASASAASLLDFFSLRNLNALH